MKFKISYLGAMALVFLTILVSSCEEDFNTIGSDIVGDTNFEASVFEDVKLAAYSRSFQAVQTNTLPSAVLGAYNDPLFGLTTASFVSQLSLSRFNPDFGDEAVLDSVVFTMPYSSAISEDNDPSTEETIYKLTNTFGEGPMQLTAFRSNFFLNSVDPDTDFEEPQQYFSNDLATFSGLEGDVLFDMDGFKPSAEEIVLVERSDEDTTITRLAPALRMKLDTLYWKENILDREGDEVLLNANNFNNYFRGVYMKATAINGTGTYQILDLTNANITLYYTFEGEDDSGDPDAPDTVSNQGTLALRFAGGNQVRAVGLENDFNPDVTTQIMNADSINGEEQLYLKGGNGSVAVIDLFNDEEQLDSIRNLGWLINEANLTFYVDREALPEGVVEPDRIYLYNTETNLPLLDFFQDPTGGDAIPAVNHLGPLERDDDGNGIRYRVRMTRFVDSILRFDVDPVKLGLVVSQSLRELNTDEVIPLQQNPDIPEEIPNASIISPLSTILHGNLGEDENTRLKLRIFYTEINN